ncbi:MAG: hypothetical protein BGO78_15835 [Chloroflexi bacterium 44-23]|nr:MAG: hypothetical protein BGO78_15835 [Chloroflexi bacterium 44-23]
MQDLVINMQDLSSEKEISNPLVSVKNNVTYNQDWPKISIITPSFNQGIFIEDTIKSIVLQNYPNLEYLIFDGGSKDDTVSIIQKYEEYLYYWESMPDDGQAHAINKGFSKCTGDIVGWINSDDMLLPESLFTIAKHYQKNKNLILLGDVININFSNKTKKTIHQKNINFENMIAPFITPLQWHQPGVFVPRQVLDPNLMLDESLRYLFDQDWMIRLLRVLEVSYIKQPVAIFRLHSKSKTVGEKFNWLSEQKVIVNRYWDYIPEKKKKKTLSYLEFFDAANSLGVKNWNRKNGQIKLRKAFLINPKIFFSWNFLQFAIRSVLPYRFIDLGRRFLIKVNLFSPND